MSGINKVILLGRLTRDPEVKDANGIAVTKFSIATSKTWKDDSGEKQEKAEFHNLVAFRKTAELVGKYLTKGRQIFVEGELSTTSYEKDGVKKYKTEIIANHIEFLGDSGKKEEASPTLGEEIPF